MPSLYLLFLVSPQIFLDMSSFILDKYDGVAPNAKVSFMDLAVTGKGLRSQSANNLFLPGYKAGARVHSNSWGSFFRNSNGYYASRELDSFLYNHPVSLLTLLDSSAPSKLYYLSLASPPYFSLLSLFLKSLLPIFSLFFRNSSHFMPPVMMARIVQLAWSQVARMLCQSVPVRRPTDLLTSTM